MKIFIVLKKSTYFFLLIIALLGGANSCSDTAKKEEKKAKKTEKKRAKNPITSISSNQEKSALVIGENIEVSVAQLDTTIRIDSVVIAVDGKKLSSSPTLPFSYEWKTKDALPGKRNVSSISYLEDGTRDTKRITFELLSDITPKKYTYEVVRDYPHDREAYTQGLLYENGFLYEGTGRKKASSLRKVDLQTGKIVQAHNLSPDLFGEGITTFKDEIFQLTWQSQEGFVYDKETFAFKRKFNYPTEGWGLTTDGEYLIMSDGSHQIYFLDPVGLTEVKRIEVYGDKGPFSNLNELEYINGEVYANSYQTDIIVKFDPKTGKVLGFVDLKGLLEKGSIRSNNVDVLNGIAYDKENDRLFVTGKWWPRLFEIRLKEINN